MSCAHLSQERIPSSAKSFSSCSQSLDELFRLFNKDELPDFANQDLIRLYLESGKPASIETLSDNPTRRLMTTLVQRYHESGISFTVKKLLEKFELPEYFRRFYHHETGQFSYRPEAPVQLAVESGSQKLGAVRLNFAPGSAIRVSVLEDYLDIIEKEDFTLLLAINQKDIEETISLIAPLPEHLRRKIEILPVAHTERASSWAQDHSKPLTGKRNTYQPISAVENHRPDDEAMVSKLGQRRDFHVIASHFAFEGGNIVVGEKHIFMGPSTIYKLMRDLNINYHEAIDAFSKEFGKPIIVVGHPVFENYQFAAIKLEQTAFHLDLSLAIVKDRSKNATGEVAVLSSPIKLFSSLLDINLDDLLDKERYVQKMSALLKDKKLVENYTEKERVILNILARTPHTEIVDQVLRFQYLALILKDAGYPVKEVPYFHTLYAAKEGTTLDENIMSRDIIGTINYTNVILSDEMAIIPEFDSPRLQRAGEQVYRELGYQRIYPASVSTENTFCAYGGIRCSSETYRVP